MSSETQNNPPEVQSAIDAFLARQRKIYRINLLAAVAMRALMLIAEWALAMLMAVIVSRLQQGELEQVRQAGEISAHSSRLSGSLEEIRALKQAQDGDYFLTARLVNPFMQHSGEGLDPKVRADFLVRQKKRFAFKKWKGEIGGDYCKLDTVTLGERRYVFFVNADAMGKSLQGAGGVLVLASAFSALLERARTEPENLQPEEWLGRTVGELNKLFLSFDGAMLVSMAMGLFDSATGTIYYINLEHPRAILVRGGEARFFEPDMHGRKLGTSEIPVDFHLTVARLLPGDTLIVGSDGRDDVVLEGQQVPADEVERGERYINYDENRFLDLVANHGTDIRVLERAIEEQADLVDDLSLLSFSYQGPADSALDDAAYDMKLGDARRVLKEKRYTEAIAVLAELVDYRPDRTDGLFAMVTALARHGDFAKARRLSRRVAWREPRHAKNLLQLAALEAKAGETGRARLLAQRAADTDSNLIEKASKLTDRLPG